MNANTIRWIALSAGTAALSCSSWFGGNDDEYEPRPSGGVPPPTGSNPTPDAGMDHGVMPPDAGSPDASVPEVTLPPTTLFVIGSDFTRGEGRRFDLTTNAFVGSALFTNGDAGGYVYEGQRWVVNRRGRDSFQGYELDSDSPTTPEISLEIGSNPQSLVVKGGRAYLPLYESSVIVEYDIAAEGPVNWHDLIRYTANDGDRNARPSASLLVGGRYAIFGNQDLPTDLWNSPTSSYTAPAKLVVLDTETGELEDLAIELPYSNVVSLSSDPDDADTIYASCSGTYDTSDDRGGIAAIRFSKRRVVRTLNDEDLGGTPGTLAVGAGSVFVTATTGFESPRVLSVGVDLMADGVFELFASNGYWIPKIVWADDRLAIADQDPVAPGLYFSSEDGVDQEGPFVVEGGLAPIDLFPYRVE